MKNELKSMLIFSLANTCAVLLFGFVITAIFNDYSFQQMMSLPIEVHLILEIFGASTVVYWCMYFTRKFESRFTIIEYLIDICLIIIVLYIFNAIFNWNQHWILAVVGIVSYLFSLSINTLKTRNDAKEINKLIKKLKEKNIESVSE